MSVGVTVGELTHVHTLVFSKQREATVPVPWELFLQQEEQVVLS